MGSRHSFSTCFELSGSSSSAVHFSLYSQPLAYCAVTLPFSYMFCSRLVGEREVTAKDYTVCQRLTVQGKSELLMMSSLKLETCRVKDN